MAFAASAEDVALAFVLNPNAAPDVAARWSAVVLARLLLLPDHDELTLLGGLKHDVNLGTHALAPLLDRDFVRNQITARGLSAACTSAAPPMWLAGSFARLSPSHAYLYALFGANHLPADVFEESPCGTVRIGLFGATGEATLETATVHRTGLGELRVRIPISRAMGIATIALPLPSFAPEGLLHGVTIQSGDDIRDAAESQDVIGIAAESLVYAGLQRNGEHYRAEGDDGCLLIPTAPTRQRHRDLFHRNHAARFHSQIVRLIAAAPAVEVQGPERGWYDARGTELTDETHANLDRLLQAGGIRLGRAQRDRLGWLTGQYGAPTLDGTTEDGETASSS